MRYVDAFNHFFPKPIWDRMLASDGAARDIGMRMRGVPAIYDLDERRRVVDLFRDKNYVQVISLGMPPLEALGEPAIAESSPGSAMTAWRSSSTATPTISSAISPLPADELSQCREGGGARFERRQRAADPHQHQRRAP